MVVEKNVERAVIIAECVMIVICGYVIVDRLIILNNDQRELSGIYIDEKFKEAPGIQLPIDTFEAERIVRMFCEPENQGNSYGYYMIKEVDNIWRIPINNVNCPCYATVNIETGETKCMKEIPL